METQNTEQEVDFNQLIKKFKEMKEENDKLKFYKTNYIEIAQRLEKSKSIIYTEINKINELIQKMHDGTHVSKKLIIDTYEIEKHQAQYIMNKIERIEKVQKRVGDNKERFLYF